MDRHFASYERGAAIRVEQNTNKYELFGAKLIQYLIQHVPRAEGLLCLTDCEPLGMAELLENCPELENGFKVDRMEYVLGQGEGELRSAIAALYGRISSDEICLELGAGHALLRVMRAALKPGDRVIAHFPAFPPIYTVPASLGCEVIRWRADPERQWKLDLDFLRDNIAGTRLVIVSFPHNPTGFSPNPEEYQKMIEICREHDAYLIGDEVYRLLENPDSSAKLAPMADSYEKGISIGSFSKAFGLPGVRIGWIACREKKLLSILGAGDASSAVEGNFLGQLIAGAALRNRGKILERNRRIIDENSLHLRKFLAENPGKISCAIPLAGPMAFPELQLEEIGAEAFCRDFFESTRLLIVPSTVLDFGDRHLRLGLGRKDFPKNLQRLSEFLSRKF